MENENRIKSLMECAMAKIKNLVDVNTVVGNPIVVQEKTFVPIVKVSIGFVAGGGEYGVEEKEIEVTENFPFAGGSGAGVCVSPVGFVSVANDKIEFLKTDNQTAFDKILDSIPAFVDKLLNKEEEDKNA